MRFIHATCDISINMNAHDANDFYVYKIKLIVLCSELVHEREVINFAFLCFAVSKPVHIWNVQEGWSDPSAGLNNLLFVCLFAFAFFQTLSFLFAHLAKY